MARATMPTITTLYSEFSEALTVLHAQTYPHTGKDEAGWNSALDTASNLAHRIMRTRASSIPEILPKITAADWLNGGQTEALSSIRADLETMQ
jgi:hypothetical protein